MQLKERESVGDSVEEEVQWEMNLFGGSGRNTNQINLLCPPPTAALCSV